jgi:hypothetical protein
VTASSVASVKIEVEQLEQLARALGVPLPATGSRASLFRLCLDRARELVPVIEQVDRIQERARVRLVAVHMETSNAGALEALDTFKRALGGTSETDATEATGRAAAPPSTC